MNSPPVVLWSHASRMITGHGEARIFDPGLGPLRYQRALDEIATEGGLGFAAFTFDPSEPGSVVVLPEKISITLDGRPNFPQQSLPGGWISDDGLAVWTEGFASASTQLDSGDLEKVVLARRAEVSFESTLPWMSLVQRLADDQPHSYIFAIDGLIGASPELLVGLEHGSVTALPLAGTAETVEGLADHRIAKEHELTARYVREILDNHVDGAIQSHQDVVDLGNMKHLGTRISGKGRKGATIADILTDLHPTPAVCGVPRDNALHSIRDLEPLSRGRYAGPVGWMDHKGDGEFAIALRCGQISGETVLLHAGGGLVRGANIEKERRETDLKLEAMLTALGVQS